MSIKVVGAPFLSKLRGLLEEVDNQSRKKSACIMCEKAINLNESNEYEYDYEGDVWCVECLHVELRPEEKEGVEACLAARGVTES